jgi:hypothetical protein
MAWRILGIVPSSVITLSYQVRTRPKSVKALFWEYNHR